MNRSMKSILPLLMLEALMLDGGISGGGGNYIAPYSEPVTVPDKLKNVPKPLSKKQKAKLKKRNQ